MRRETTTKRMYLQFLLPSARTKRRASANATPQHLTWNYPLECSWCSTVFFLPLFSFYTYTYSFFFGFEVFYVFFFSFFAFKLILRMKIFWVFLPLLRLLYNLVTWSSSKDVRQLILFIYEVFILNLRDIIIKIYMLRSIWIEVPMGLWVLYYMIQSLSFFRVFEISVSVRLNKLSLLFPFLAHKVKLLVLVNVAWAHIKIVGIKITDKKCV